MVVQMVRQSYNIGLVFFVKSFSIKSPFGVIFLRRFHLFLSSISTVQCLVTHTNALTSPSIKQPKEVMLTSPSLLNLQLLPPGYS